MTKRWLTVQITGSPLDVWCAWLTLTCALLQFGLSILYVIVS
jgi:hypothetical protein